MRSKKVAFDKVEIVKIDKNKSKIEKIIDLKELPQKENNDNYSDNCKNSKSRKKGEACCILY